MMAAEPQQRFRSLLAATVFPGRNSITVFEAAHVLRVSEQHIINLIEEGQFKAISVAGANSERSRYRIAVSEWDAYILRGGKSSAANQQNI